MKKKHTHTKFLTSQTSNKHLLCLLHMHFAFFTSAENATWFALQKTSHIISLAAYLIILLQKGAYN
jgi:hypothetical protein